MWIAFIVVTIIIACLFIYMKARIFISNKKYQKEHAPIFDAHKAMGYPPLTEAQQFDILDNENTEHLSKLTQYEFVPTGLLNHYLNIDPARYYAHLKTLNLKDKLKFDPGNLRDGFFIDQTSKGFEYLYVQRQSIQFRKRFDSYDSLLYYIVYDKLRCYAPKKYKRNWF